MDKKEFLKIRSYLGKTQSEMAQLMGVSLKSIQSFEQGWRKIPTHIERQALFLLSMKKRPRTKDKPCWETQKCSLKTKRNCPAWEFQSGRLCWFINGTICYGEVQENWQKKMKVCRQCVVFLATFPPMRTKPEKQIPKVASG